MKTNLPEAGLPRIIKVEESTLQHPPLYPSGVVVATEVGEKAKIADGNEKFLASRLLKFNSVTSEKTVTVSIKGCMYFNSIMLLRRYCIGHFHDSKIEKIVLNLSGVESMDSSSLGLLLELRDLALRAEKSMALAALSNFAVRKLEVSNFSRLFSIVQ